MSAKPTDVVAGILVKAGKVLISRRLQGDSFGGKWEFPGGTVVGQESPKTALKRELFEELGIQVRVDSLFLRAPGEKQSGGTLNLAFYRVTMLPGSPPPRAKEVSTWRWMRPRDLWNIDFIPSNYEVIRRLQRLL